MKKIVVAVALLALAGCSAEPQPVPTVTQTETTPGPTVTTPGPTVTKEVESVPDVCMAALDHADDVITSAGEALQLVPDVLEAYQYEDLDAMDRAGTKLAGYMSDMESAGPSYVDSKEECRDLR